MGCQIAAADLPQAATQTLAQLGRVITPLDAP
jgi:hypothetical protein